MAGLEQVSHVWLLFLFHQALEDNPRLKVRPPRLGGNRALGVFATRATHRPNGIGQSVVKLDRVEPGGCWLSGIDLLDGTPVLDIKPYVPYADRCPRPQPIADAPPVAVAVDWRDSAWSQARAQAQRLDEPLMELIEQCLAQDPRPAYQVPEPERRYGVRSGTCRCAGITPRPGASACWRRCAKRAERRSALGNRGASYSPRTLAAPVGLATRAATAYRYARGWHR